MGQDHVLNVNLRINLVISFFHRYPEKLVFSTKVTVYASCRGGLVIVPWFFE